MFGCHPTMTQKGEKLIDRIARMSGGVKVGMVRHALAADGGEPTGRTARWVTNMPAARVTMRGRCGQSLESARIVRSDLTEATKLQRRWDQDGMYMLASLGDKDVGRTSRGAHATPAEEEDGITENLMEAWDDVTGRDLDPRRVKEARDEEMAYYKKMGTYEKVTWEEMRKITDKKPIKVRWVDINKGDEARQQYRSRLVAKEYNREKGRIGDGDLFAATPPLEALRAIISLGVTGDRSKAIMVNDISRAYMYAEARGDTFIEIPDEDVLDGEQGKYVGRLRKAMYGTRAAAQCWQREFARTLRAAGFEQGRASPCVFYHQEKDIVTFVHGDDFVSSGEVESLKWPQGVLASAYQIKTDGG